MKTEVTTNSKPAQRRQPLPTEAVAVFVLMSVQRSSFDMVRRGAPKCPTEGFLFDLPSTLRPTAMFAFFDRAIDGFKLKWFEPLKPALKNARFETGIGSANDSQLEGASPRRLESIRTFNRECDRSRHPHHCGVANNCNPNP